MKKTVAFVTLGCSKNTVLSEYMMGVLRESPYQVVTDIAEADAIVVNTCGFINDAKTQSIETIIDLAELKESGRCQYIIALGCLIQKYANDLSIEMPEIDLLLGSTEYDHIVEHLDNLFNQVQEKKVILEKTWPKKNTFRPEIMREVTTPKDYAYLMISEGCNNRCAYCAIPQMQGPHRSRPMEDIISEAQYLVNNGAKELIVLAQDTSYYGKDLYGRFCLDDLLEKLALIKDLKWIRLLYAYPNNFSDEMIEVMAKYDNICHYIDIPLQHASDRVLKNMYRNITQDEIRRLIVKLREKMPDIVIRSTFISGFPGETEEDHEILLQFLEEMKLDRVGVFPYSQEENTVAGRMKEQLSDEVKEARAEELMEVQFDIMVEKHKLLIGKELLVKIDSREGDLVYCRSYGESPEIDPYIILRNFDSKTEGEYFTVKITGIDGYDLIGEYHELT